MDVICMGELLIDFTPGAEPRSYTANPGGAPANVVISLARNGLETGFLGKVGDDDFGRLLSDTLAADHVTFLSSTPVKEAVTTMAFVTLNQQGERSFTFARKPGADQLIKTTDINSPDIDNCRLFHAGSFSLSHEPAREAVVYAMNMARGKGKLVSFDINFREMIWNKEDCKEQVDKILDYVDLLKISDEELFFVGGEANIPGFMAEHDISILIQTMGGDGAKYYCRGTAAYGVHIPGYRVNVVDTTGAGDAFWGGFLSRILFEKNITEAAQISEGLIREAVVYGNTSGALCVQKSGGIPALPTKNEIAASL